MEQEVLIINNIAKKFKIGTKKKQSSVMHFISFFSGVEPKKEFWALKNVSFTLKKGEKIGIIGPNGSGKSTLLKIIADIYEPTWGKIKRRGKIFLALNMSKVFKKKLTAREMIHLICSVLGLSQKDIKKYFDQIINFAELEDFTDTKLYQFSSGMKMRLSFSILIHCLEHLNADIVLFDEPLAGTEDERFKNKSLKKIEKLMSEEKSIIFVGHKLSIMQKYCSRIIWLDKGEILEEGNTQEIINKYLKLANQF